MSDRGHTGAGEGGSHGSSERGIWPGPGALSYSFHKCFWSLAVPQNPWGVGSRTPRNTKSPDGRAPV